MATVSVRYIVDDVDAAIAFYTQHLGFHEDMHPAPTFAMLSRGDLRLVLSVPSGAGGGGQAMPDGTKPAPGGWNRFSLEVSDLLSTVEEMRKTGVHFRNHIVTGVGGKQILLDDPSGNPVELFEPTQREASLSEYTPTVYEWAGGAEAFDRLTDVFYRNHVHDDEILGPVFANMPADHPHHVALWLAEVFSGPPKYSEHHGGYAHMVAKHIGLALTERQRARWVQLIALAADDAELPADPEFRSAFMAYIEWGTRLALHNSQPGADPPRQAPMPHWGWGEAPPYQP
jgi:hemoglobin